MLQFLTLLLLVRVSSCFSLCPFFFFFLFFFDIVWSGITLRFVIATDTVTGFAQFTGIGLRGNARVFTNYRNTMLVFIFTRVGTNCSCPCIFSSRQISFFSSKYCPKSKLNVLMVSFWFQSILSAKLRKMLAGSSENVSKMLLMQVTIGRIRRHC